MSKRRVELLAGEPHKGETSKAIQACNDWLRLGPGRSLLLLHERYQAKTGPNPPTQSHYTLKDWSARYDWASRAPLYDQEQENLKNEQRRRIMQQGLALDYERVLLLIKLAELLEGQLYEQDGKGDLHNLWLPDVKVIPAGRGKTQQVDIVRFNAALVRELRGAVADLAAETGGRRQVQESWDVDVSQLPMEALERLAAGEKLIDVLLDITAAKESSG